MPSAKKSGPDRPPDVPEDAAALDARQDEAAALVRFHDVPVEVSVELARKRVKVREILNLHVDMVIQMDQSAGENVDLRLNGMTAGNGEIVVIENMMGLRVTDLKARAFDRE